MQAAKPMMLLLSLATAFSLGVPSTADAQILKKLKKTVQRAAEDETLSQIDRLVRDGVGCLFDDLECIAQAREEGDDVYLTDEDGNPLVDGEGNPVSDPTQAAQIMGTASSAGTGMRPGEGAWARYDFVPGEDVLLVADYADDNVGDFPRRFELVRGSWEVVEWRGGRYLRALSGGMLSIPLPETLPDRFTLETSLTLAHGNAFLRILPGESTLTRASDYSGSMVSAQWRQTGIRANRQGPESMTLHDQSVWDDVTPLRIMADGDYVKVYLGERRMANVPNAVYPRTDRLFVSVGSASRERPILMGPVRIAAGGADLYDRLATEGRVATQGILFDVDSDRIRPESTPTLREIGTMLQEHPDLRISIEGHTDSDGDEAYNLELSRRRAAAVRSFLMEAYAIDAGRLESAGLGESAPVAPNNTPEGRQQNRRVELVRLGGS